MLNALDFIILVKICTMISNCKSIPYFNILQKFVENVRKKHYPELVGINCIQPVPPCIDQQGHYVNKYLFYVNTRGVVDRKR